MWKHRELQSLGLAAALAFGLAGAANAAAPLADPAQVILHWTDAPAETLVATPAVAAAPAPTTAEAAAAPASDAALDDLAGRGPDGSVTVALTEQSLSAVNTGNTINAGQVGSGAISLQDSALSGFSGISNVMMNTGHNNNLQSNMSVTVIVTP